jgi:PqqA peptide cyclase
MRDPEMSSAGEPGAIAGGKIPPPVSLLAEVTHRCPLQCPYCSNPLALERAAGELDTATWQRVIEEAHALGVLQTHFSGGEPTLRRDLPDLVRHASALGQYTNLITAAVLLDQEKLDALAEAGLDHVQISIQDSEAANADRIGGYKNGHEKKLAVARRVKATGLPLTINAVMHRQNLDHLERIIALAVELGAKRLEVAHVQYYGWALVNRAALMPTREQAERSIALVEGARERLKGVLTIDYVVPDYYARYPKPCMGGWGRQNLNVTPSGKVLPCHAAEGIASLTFDNVRDRPLADIWYHGAAFNAFRGTDWMQEPCRSCPRRFADFGGCRCQAFAMTGEARATDPACSLSPNHQELVATAVREAASAPPGFVYRRPGNAQRAGRMETATPAE